MVSLVGAAAMPVDDSRAVPACVEPDANAQLMNLYTPETPPRRMPPMLPSFDPLPGVIARTPGAALPEPHFPMKSLSPAVLAEPDLSDLCRAAAPRPAQAACVVWLTGLSGAGKSTLAEGLRARLVRCGVAVAVLDGDTVRQGLSQGLGFSEQDRRENVRRIAEVARLLSAQGVLVVVAAIAPRRAQRALARQIVGPAYREVHVDAPVGLCEHRDVKGLYARVRRGELTQFTGVSDDYEMPTTPDLRIDTAALGIAEAVQQLTVALVGRWMAAGWTATPGAEPA